MQPFICLLLKLFPYLSTLLVKSCPHTTKFPCTVDPWTTWVWTAYIHLYMDFFFHITVLHIQAWLNEQMQNLRYRKLSMGLDHPQILVLEPIPCRYQGGLYKLSIIKHHWSWRSRHYRGVMRTMLGRKKPKVDAKWKLLDQQGMEPWNRD